MEHKIEDPWKAGAALRSEASGGLQYEMLSKGIYLALSGFSLDHSVF